MRNKNWSGCVVWFESSFGAKVRFLTLRVKLCPNSYKRRIKIYPYTFDIIFDFRRRRISLGAHLVIYVRFFIQSILIISKSKGLSGNTSRYPYLVISNRTATFHKYVIWLLKLEIYWKYCEKEEKLLLRSNFSSFPQYFVTRCKISMWEPDFHFEISDYSR